MPSVTQQIIPRNGVREWMRMEAENRCGVF